jgi:hypothetical protein
MAFRCPDPRPRAGGFPPSLREPRSSILPFTLVSAPFDVRMVNWQLPGPGIHGTTHVS